MAVGGAERDTAPSIALQALGIVVMEEKKPLRRRWDTR